MTTVTDPSPVDRWSGERGEIGSPLAGYLQRVLERHRANADGAVATYIPELGKADPSWFGIAAATLDGTVHAVGDTRIPFTIQSISKPLTYALILDDLGEIAVRSRIGVEPTGDAFNAITLDPATGRPLNPMVNAGAIAAAGLVRPAADGSALDRLLDGYGQFVGRSVSVDRAVEASERASGHRNRAIGHLLRASGVLDGDADEALERYFAQCSVEVSAIDLAIIAATLANGGVNPLTGRRAASAEAVRSVQAVMSTCGMYDGAGEWLYSIGLPAKSGVSGGILVVVPGQLGLGFFSPPLDRHGNSVRGGLACRDIVRELDLHPLGAARREAGALRCAYTVAQVSSKRRRTAAGRAALAASGHRALILELHGVVTFLAVESVAASVAAAVRLHGPLETLVMDMRRVELIEPAAVALLAALIRDVAGGGGRALLSGAARHRAAAVRLADEVGVLEVVGELDAAIELAEDDVLSRVGYRTDKAIAGSSHPALAGLDDVDRKAVIAAAHVRSYAAGSSIVTVGDPSDELFFVLSGRLSVATSGDPGGRRLSTLDAGMLFGETALLGGGRRTADVRADSSVTCLVLTADAFKTIERERPAAAISILRNLLDTATATTSRLTREMSILSG